MNDNILTKIIENKQRELVVRKKLLSLEHLKRNLAPSLKSLFDALNSEKSDFIFECKKASPSKGLLRKNYNLDKILSIYKDYASAISVLTDHRYFQGSFEHLKKVTRTAEQPILCKDFFIDIYQVYEARYFGADAILLMLSVLNDEQYRLLASVAKEMKLDILTEVHSDEEMKRAIHLDAKIIGVNNRNLKNLSINLNVTEKLIGNLKKSEHVNRIFISESGISNRQQVKRLSPLVNGFLIGSSIMSQKDIRQQCKKLIYGTTKICGLTNQESANVAFEQGAIYGGLIFYSKSPRYVDLYQAKKIIDSVKLEYVGVFVNEPERQLIDIASQLKLNVIQLHGNENDEYIKTIKQALPQCEIWKAISIKNDALGSECSNMNNQNVDHYLLDSYDERLIGGSGKVFDWSKLTTIDTKDIILAGGINVNNIEQANRLNTFALDINSGVEDSPGLKNKNKIAEIFRALRA